MSKIEITKEEYLGLKLCELKLNMLECGGVDNWEWYGESLYGDQLEDGDFEKLSEELKEKILG